MSLVRTLDRPCTLLSTPIRIDQIVIAISGLGQRYGPITEIFIGGGFLITVPEGAQGCTCGAGFRPRPIKSDSSALFE